MNIEVVALVVASIAVLAVVVLTVVTARNRNRGGEDALSSALADMRVALAGRDGSLDAKVSELDSKLASLKETVTTREAVLDEQVRGMGAQMQGIAGLFSNDRARGGWGEISMLRIFEMGGLVEDRDYTAQFHAGDRTPDAVVHLPGGRNIVIDSKFPIARYNEALAADDEQERMRLLVEQSKELERVAKTLIDRGYAELAAGGYVVMYLPSQAVYEAAAAADPDVIGRLLKKRVVIAGPTALYSLLMSVGSLMSEHRAMQQADEILDEVRELHRRMAVFVEHLGGVGNALGKTVAVFNGAVGSWTSRVAPQLGR
ncbi:MAG: DNA recombination protein RmuC, partial [Actinomycetota bacterium]|nr:DNA recombination protein RmuC [Actinomycetota bacterium]